MEELQETAIRNQIGFEEAFLNTGDNLQEILKEVAKTKNIDVRRTKSSVSKSGTTSKSNSR